MQQPPRIIIPRHQRCTCVLCNRTHPGVKHTLPVFIAGCAIAGSLLFKPGFVGLLFTTYRYIGIAAAAAAAAAATVVLTAGVVVVQVLPVVG